MVDDQTGVNEPESPTDNEEIVEPTEKSGEKPDDPSRGMDELRGELLRKQEKGFKEMQREFRTMAQDLASALKPQPQRNPNDPSTFTVPELKGLRAQVSDEQRTELEDLITKRVLQDALDQQAEELTQNHERKAAHEKAGQIAVDRYPELEDEDSEFAQKVETKLAQLGETYVKANPNAVLDVANEVAILSGAKPTVRRAVQNVTQPARKKNSAPVENETDSGIPELSDEDYAEIEKKLKHAMPDKKFDKEKIKKEYQGYAGSIDYFIRR